MEPPLQESYKENEDFVAARWLKSYQPSIFNLSRLWNSLKFSYARRLLSMANSGNRAVRIRAVTQLGRISNLDSWHYSLLAHMCDARTAVGLARARDVDFRFFLEPPFRYITYNHEMIVNTMKEFLIALHAKSKHLCLGYFISRAFIDVQVKFYYHLYNVRKELLINI